MLRLSLRVISRLRAIHWTLPRISGNGFRGLVVTHIRAQIWQRKLTNSTDVVQPESASNKVVRKSWRPIRLFSLPGHLIGSIMQNNFNMFLKLLIQRRRWKLALGELEDRRQKKGEPPEPSVYSQFISSLMRHADPTAYRHQSTDKSEIYLLPTTPPDIPAWQAAALLYNHMVNFKVISDVAMCCSLIELLGKHRQWRKAIHLPITMRLLELPVTADVIITCIEACVYNNELGIALKMYERLRQEFSELSTAQYNRLIEALGRAGRIDIASLLFAELKTGPRPDTESYRCMITASAFNRIPRRALELWQELLQSGLPLTTAVYNAAIRACGEEGDVDTARALYEAMCQNAHSAPNATTTTPAVPDNNTFIALIAGYQTDHKHSQHMRTLLSEMRSQGIVPSANTLVALIEAFGKCGDLSGAISVVDVVHRAIWRRKLSSSSDTLDLWDLQLPFPDATIYAAAMKVCYENGDVQTVLSLFHELESTMPPNVEAWSIMARIYIEQGDTAKALEALQNMQQTIELTGVVPPAVYKELLEFMLNARAVAPVIVLHDLVKQGSVELDVATLHSMIQLLAHSFGAVGGIQNYGKEALQRACTIVREMFEKNIPLTIEAILPLVDALSRSGAVPALLEIFLFWCKQQDTRDYTQDSGGGVRDGLEQQRMFYQHVIDGCLRGDNPAAAKQVLEHMQRPAVHGGEALIPPRRVFEAVITAAWDLDQYALAAEVGQMMKAAGITPSKHVQVLLNVYESSQQPQHKQK